MREAKEDPNLAEVKAVLKELQRLDFTAPAGHASETSSKLQRQPSPSPSKTNIDVFDRKRAALVKADRPRSARRTPWYFLTAFVLIGGGAAYLYATGIVPSVIKTEATVSQKQDDIKLLTESRRLLTEGDVILARTRLLQGGPETRAELALTLAQSYDPNYLRSLSKSNGLPDRAEAERWYRKWYELAVGSGLEMDSERLKRIINAMQ
jgi:hypothetical protein